MHGEYPKIRPRKCRKIMIPHQGSTSLEACRNWWPSQKTRNQSMTLKTLDSRKILVLLLEFFLPVFFLGGSLTALPPVYNLHKERCQHLQTWEVANWSRIAWRPVKLKRLAGKRHGYSKYGVPPLGAPNTWISPKKGRTIKDGEAIWDRDPPKHKIDWLGVDFLLEEFLKKKRQDEMR